MNSPIILLIEDNLSTRRLVRQLLTKTPYRLIEAATGEAALEACFRETPHLMIIDLHLPGTLTGLDVVRRIEFVPFLILTGDSDDAMVSACKDAGALTYLVKPIDPDKFLPVIETALARASERQGCSMLVG